MKRQLSKTTVVRRCVREGIVEATAIPLRGVYKSVEIFLDIDRFKEEAFVPDRLGVFGQNSCGTTVRAVNPCISRDGYRKAAARNSNFE
jgi:hypothetical protein